MGMKLRIFLSCILLCGYAIALDAKESFGNLRVKEILRVHDGDTFIAHINDVHPLIGQGISIRINGIDTPEITDKNPSVHTLAIQAREYVKERLQQNVSVELRNVRRDKYFRILADVYLDQQNLADELIAQGLAKPYHGKTKPIWP